MPLLIANILLLLLASSAELDLEEGKNHTYHSGKELVEILHQHAKQNSEIIHLVLSSDTLLIVTTHEFSTYPLGKFSDFAEFEAVVFNDKNYNGSTEKCSNKTVHRYAFDGGYVKAMKTQDGSIEIVFAKVDENAIWLSNGMEIGEDQSGVLSVFFDDLKDLDFDVISVIRIESGVTGVWQYYAYREGKLKSIVIDSDYQCDKR